MITHTIASIQAKGFTYTGKLLPNITIAQQQRIANELDYKVKDIFYFLTAQNEWTAFIAPNAIKGFKSESILP